MDEAHGRLRFSFFLCALICSALILGARLLYWYMGDPQRFPVTTFKIAATYQHITRKELETILGRYQNDSFFSLQTAQLKEDLTGLSWINKVEVERIWPDTIKIILSEHEAVALWNGALLNRQGEVFIQRGVSSDMALPILSGPEPQKIEVLQNYEKLSKLLVNYGLHAAALELRDNQAWDLVLSNGIKLRLGKRDLEKRILRFCRAFPAIFADKPEQIASVDLRYARGLAVQWKEPVNK